MATPPMLRSGVPLRDSREAADPLVSVNVAAMAILALGLFLAGVLAVYDWRTPGAEAPLVFWLAAIAVALLLLDLLVVGFRCARRLRLGL